MQRHVAPPGRAFTDFTNRLDDYGRAGEACVFIIDFEAQQPLLFTLPEADEAGLWYNFRGITNRPVAALLPPLPFWLEARPPAPATYHRAFSIVQHGLARGDSFLVNLTFPTAIATNWTLDDLYLRTQAAYRLRLPGRFACFSPEPFVQIQDGHIYTYPMKGTAPDQPGALEALLANPKEQAEHATIVDLLRNDLSRVASGVHVSRYRYAERVARRGGLWQTSSEIVGRLPADWPRQLGQLLANMLPAGSVSGAPKESTLRIIRRAEGRPRGYYCGVAGIYDGERLDSCVLIRFVELDDQGGKWFWSGGGITARSAWESEYAELRNKVYFPTVEARQRVIPENPLS